MCILFSGDKEYMIVENDREYITQVFMAWQGALIICGEYIAPYCADWQPAALDTIRAMVTNNVE